MYICMHTRNTLNNNDVHGACCNSIKSKCPGGTYRRVYFEGINFVEDGFRGFNFYGIAAFSSMHAYNIKCMGYKCSWYMFSVTIFIL